MHKNSLMFMSMAVFYLSFGTFSSCSKENKADTFEPAAATPLPPDTYDTGIIMSVWEHPEVLRVSLESLRNSNLPEKTVVVIIDDASSNAETQNILRNFAKDMKDSVGPKFVHMRMEKNGGLLNVLLRGFNYLKDSVKYISNIDPDTYLKKNWVQDLHKTYEAINDKNIILTGFNVVPAHPIVGECKSIAPWDEVQKRFYCEKADMGGINFFFSTEFFKAHLEKKYVELSAGNWKTWDHDIMKFMHASGFKLYTTSPSVIQHLGTRGTNSRPDGLFDFAKDF